VKRAEPTVQRRGRPLSSTEGKASIRANKPVPECRTQLHAVADDPLDGSLDEPERDDAGRSDTSCDISGRVGGWSAYLTIPSSTGRARKTADDARPIAPLVNSTHLSVTFFPLPRGLHRWRSELLRNPDKGFTYHAADAPESSPCVAAGVSGRVRIRLPITDVAIQIWVRMYAPSEQRKEGRYGPQPL
jgi:hypothetical protein